MTRPSAPIRMAHVALTVTADELNEVSQFYQSVFGWTLEFEINGVFGHHQFLTDQHGARIELLTREVVERPKWTEDPPGHICFAVPEEEFDSLLERARNAGVDIGQPQVATSETRGETDPETGELRTGGGTSHFIFFDDPSGNCLEVSTGACRFLT